MKNQIKSIIFAVVFGTLLSTTNTSYAANDNDSVASVNNVLLVRGAENKFADFMNQNAKRFVKKQKGNWNVFEQVVTLYNVSPSQLLNASTETKMAFNEAVKNVDKKLGKMNAADAKLWKNKVNATANVINYLWNNKFDAQQLEMPTSETNQLVAFEAVGE